MSKLSTFWHDFKIAWDSLVIGGVAGFCIHAFAWDKVKEYSYKVWDWIRSKV